MNGRAMNSPALWDLCHALLDKIGWPPNLAYNHRRFYHPERSVPLPDDLAEAVIYAWLAQKLDGGTLTELVHEMST